jgi:DUF4097 and DUF4098 domain-containing protein YvlB
MSIREERQLILQMLADGKVTPQEAADLIRALVESEAGEEKHEGHAHHATHEEHVRGAWVRTPRTPRAPRPPREPGEFRFEMKGLLHELQHMVEEISESVAGAVEGLPFNQPQHETVKVIEGKLTAAEPTIRLNLTNGSLKVRPWEKEECRLEVRIQGRAADKETFETEAMEAFTVEIDEERLSFDGKGGLITGLKTDVTLFLPEPVAYHLTAQVGNGKVDVAGIKLLQGSLTTTNGKLTCHAAHAQTLLATTGNGAMTLLGEIENLDAHTSNGAIRYQPQCKGSGQQKLTTGNGAISVDLGALPEAVGIKVEAETAMGGIALSGSRLARQVEERTLGQKRLVAQSANWNEAEQRLNLVLHSSMGAIRVQ